MEKLSTVVTRLQQKPTGSMQLSPTPSQTLPICQSGEGQEQLTNMIGQCYQALNMYGKEPEQMAATIRIFHLVLADYPIDRITAAFGKWLETNSTFPAPADIVSLIRRGGKPPLERSYYISISKKPADQRTKAEWGYLRDYEEFLREG